MGGAAGQARSQRACPLTARLGRDNGQMTGRRGNAGNYLLRAGISPFKSRYSILHSERGALGSRSSAGRLRSAEHPKCGLARSLVEFAAVRREPKPCGGMLRLETKRTAFDHDQRGSALLENECESAAVGAGIVDIWLGACQRHQPKDAS